MEKHDDGSGMLTAEGFRAKCDCGASLGVTTLDGAADAQSRHRTDAVLAVFAAELRDEAGDIEAAHSGEPGGRHRPIVAHLRFLAGKYEKESNGEG